MPPEAPLPPTLGKLSMPHHGPFETFAAPESWNRSPIMRILSPSSDLPCASCGFTSSPAKIFSGPVHIVCTSRHDCQLRHERGARDGCFVCTIVCALLRLASTADLDHGKHCVGSGQEALPVHTKPGLFVFRCHAKCASSRAWQVFIPDSAPAGFSEIPRLRSLDGASSPQALKFLKSQIKTCLKTHPRCQVKSKDYIPTRLLHVTKGGLLQLRFQTDIPTGANYTALCHRWDDEADPCCLTTRENIEDRKNNISWDEIPSVFDDFIKLSLGLGVSYVWIDSLCIVQDDAEDREREATSMMRIFNNALVTIAALCSGSPQQSMFCKNTSLQQKLVTVKHGSKRHDLFARELTLDMPAVMFRTSRDGIAAPSLGRNDRNSFSLLMRAWPFQDCLVSSRVAYIGAQEVSMECREAITCECGLHHTDDTVKPQHALAKWAPTSPLAATLFGKRTREDGWQDMVTKYSALKLSSEKDRLLALGGYAQQYAQANVGQQYLAGLWSGNLVQHLLWTTTTPVPVVTADEPGCIAPSWSWASAGGPVTFPWQHSRTNGPRMDFSIVEASCKSADGNPFGVAVSGWLRLKGNLTTAKLSHSRKSQGYRQISVEDSLGEIIHDVRPDRVPIELSNNSAPCSNRELDTTHPASDADAAAHDVHLLKLFDAQSSSVYMILREAPGAELPIRLQTAQIKTYTRVGIAVRSTEARNEMAGAHNDTPQQQQQQQQQPRAKPRRSSSQALIDGLARILSQNGPITVSDGEILLV
ncbi:HET domain-containing protein [Microdochium nivale]|nr:HET domain-containing protein [Microdochium nivale]